MEIIVRIIEVVIWPATVLFVAFMFRRQLVSTFGRLREVEWGKFKARFDQELRKAEQIVEAELTIRRAVVEMPELPRDEKSADQQFSVLVEVAPRTAITEAWIAVEQAIVQLAKSLGVIEYERRTHYKLMRDFLRRDIVNEHFVKMYDQLRLLRNEAAHAPDFLLSAEEAGRYVDLAEGLVRDLNEVRLKHT